jgi:hypothetical protein
MGRIVVWIVLGVIVLAGTFVAGDILDPIDAEPSAPPPVATLTPFSPSPTSVSPEPAPDPDDPASYYTTDGSDPPLFPECDGAMGLCLGAPIDRAIAAFGIEDERFASGEPGGLVRAWNLEGLRLTTQTDQVGSITSITVSTGGGQGGLRVALPEQLVLGALTMGDVVDRLGPPSERDEFAGENVWFYDYRYTTGPEGSHVLTFTHASEGQPVGSQALADRQVSSFTAAFRT